MGDKAASPAKGSEETGVRVGREKGDRWGWGVADLEPGADGPEVKAEKGAGEVDFGSWPLALLSWVTDERSAGPGMSGVVSRFLGPKSCRDKRTRVGPKA